MSQDNPYLPTVSVEDSRFAIRKVSINPFDLLGRGYRLLGDQYWLFLGITVVGMLIGSAVPFGLLLGAMLVGIFLCYAARERGERVEFGTLFKGFEDFGNSLVAIALLVAASFLVVVPFVIAMIVVIMLAAGRAQAAGQNGPPEFPAMVLVLYALMLVVNLLVTIPFAFTFQLIADRKLRAIPAIKASLSGVLKNFFGVLFYFIVLTLISIPLAMLCYIPVFLFFPISMGSIFVLYRDIYPREA